MKTEIIILLAIAFVVFLFAMGGISKLLKFRHEFIVPTGYAGLLHHHGKFIEVLAPGRHVRWGRNLTVDASDTRKASFAVASQEVLTADNIGVKFSLLVTYQIADAVKAAHDTQSWHTDLYNAAQLALRSVVSGVAAETLLTQRLDIAPQLLARVQPDAAKVGITVHAVEVKDVMLPAELKRAFGDVLKAKYQFAFVAYSRTAQGAPRRLQDRCHERRGIATGCSGRSAAPPGAEPGRSRRGRATASD